LSVLLVYANSVYGRVNDPPVVTCLEVHEAGDVTIYWQSLDATVMEFKIYYSIDNVNWFFVDIVDVPNTSLSYHHNAARADTIMYHYYIKATYPGGIVANSDAFSTIFLNVINTTVGQAALYWNAVHTPLPQGSSTYYHIFRSNYEPGIPDVWELVDSVTNTSYNYIIPDGICNDSINFKIEIDNTFGCSSVSNIAGDWFSEDIQPEKPIFDSVSIVNNSEVILGWKPSVSSDVIGTIIYRWENIQGIDKWIVIDTVYVDSSYIDTDYLPCDTNYLYAIAALPTCGIPSPKTEETAQRPILLHNLTSNLCSHTITLTWEHYINAMQPFNKYEIWSSKATGVFELVGQVSSSDNVYTHSGVENATNYDYFVRAVFGNPEFTSTSCTKSITTGTFVIPDSVYLANADVLPDNTVELTLDVDLKPTTCTWEVYRSDATSGSQSLLKSFQRSDIAVSPYSFIDESANGSTGYYTYSVTVIDSCGNNVLQSNTLKTIFLTGERISDAENKLNWNLFEGWDSNVDKYYIYRMLGGVVPTKPIDSVDNLSTEYIDDLTTVSSSETKFSYWVQATEAGVNSYGYDEKSNSNIVSLFKETNFYFPNAFRPNGKNREFKPVTLGFGGSNYLLQIYNRWGQLIFESSEYDKGWDGSYNHQKSPMGTYVYRLTYTNVFGADIQQKGTVTLID